MPFFCATDFQGLASAEAFLLVLFTVCREVLAETDRGRVGVLAHQLKPWINMSHATASCISTDGASLHIAHLPMNGPSSSNIARASCMQTRWRTFAYLVLNERSPESDTSQFVGQPDRIAGGPFPNQILPGRGTSRSLCGLSLQRFMRFRECIRRPVALSRMDLPTPSANVSTEHRSSTMVQ